MKYIRTKDKIIAIDNKKYEIVEINDMTLLQTNIESKQIFREYIVSQADTIEELCDEFVVVRENKKPVSFINLEQVNLNRGNYGYSNSIVYGAIWTEWGLKYVAKMNEKGELELL